MNRFLSLFSTRRGTRKIIDINVRMSKTNDLTEDTIQIDGLNVAIPDLATPLLYTTKKKMSFPSRQSLMSSNESLFESPSSLSPVKKRMSLFSSKESLMSSKESLSSIPMTSGVAYRRHPDDRGSKFGRPHSVGTSKACFGRYSMLDIDRIDEIVVIDEDTKEISFSLTSLERIESIQKKAFEIAHNRRKYQRNRENKKRPLSDEDFVPRRVKVQSMIELSSDEMNVLNADVLLIDSATPIITRKSSLQKKSWEIRLERKRKMKKRRSEGYQVNRFPLNVNS